MLDPWTTLALAMSALALGACAYGRLHRTAAMTGAHAEALADALKLAAAATMQHTASNQVAAQRLRLDFAGALLATPAPAPEPAEPDPHPAGMVAAPAVPVVMPAATQATVNADVPEPPWLAELRAIRDDVRGMAPAPAAQTLPVADPAPTVPASVAA